MAVSAFKLGLQYRIQVKEDLAMKSPQNLEEILSRARGFVKLEEEKSHYWGNVKGRELRKETFRKMEKD